MYLDMRRWRAEVDLDTLMKPKEEGGYDFAERQAVADRGWKMCALHRAGVMGAQAALRRRHPDLRSCACVHCLRH